MPTNLRIATFNLLNLDDRPGRMPTLDERIPIMRPQLVRLNADILCLQEVCGQEEHGKFHLSALNKLLQSTPYEGYHRFSTIMMEGTSQVYESRNLVILSRYEIVEHHQYMHTYAPSPISEGDCPARGERGRRGLLGAAYSPRQGPVAE